MGFSEYIKIAPLLNSANIDPGADAKSVNMGAGHSASFILLFGSGLTGDAKMTVYAGATAGAKTTAITSWKGRLTSAVVGNPNADVYGSTLITVDSGQNYATLTGTTFAGKMLVLELSARDMPEGKPWLTISIGNEATAGTLQIIGLINSRYRGEAIPTVLPAA